MDDIALNRLGAGGTLKVNLQVGSAAPSSPEACFERGRLEATDRSHFNYVEWKPSKRGAAHDACNFGSVHEPKLENSSAWCLRSAASAAVRRGVGDAASPYHDVDAERAVTWVDYGGARSPLPDAFCAGDA